MNININIKIYKKYNNIILLNILKMSISINLLVIILVILCCFLLATIVADICCKNIRYYRGGMSDADFTEATNELKQNIATDFNSFFDRNNAIDKEYQEYYSSNIEPYYESLRNAGVGDDVSTPTGDVSTPTGDVSTSTGDVSTPTGDVSTSTDDNFEHQHAHSQNDNKLEETIQLMSNPGIKKSLVPKINQKSKDNMTQKSIPLTTKRLPNTSASGFGFGDVHEQNDKILAPTNKSHRILAPGRRNVTPRGPMIDSTQATRDFNAKRAASAASVDSENSAASLMHGRE